MERGRRGGAVLGDKRDEGHGVLIHIGSTLAEILIPPRNNFCTNHSAPCSDLQGNINLIEAALKKGVKKFVLVTSIGWVSEPGGSGPMWCGEVSEPCCLYEVLDHLLPVESGHRHPQCRKSPLPLRSCIALPIVLPPSLPLCADVERRRLPPARTCTTLSSRSCSRRRRPRTPSRCGIGAIEAMGAPSLPHPTPLRSCGLPHPSPPPKPPLSPCRTHPAPLTLPL